MKQSLPPPPSPPPSIAWILGAYASLLFQVAIVIGFPVLVPLHTAQPWKTLLEVIWIVCSMSLLGRVLYRWKKDLP
jgi:hypothetical protein